MQVAAQPTRPVGSSAIDQTGAVHMVDEEVPLSVDALLRVVVLECRFPTQDSVELEGPFNVGLGVGAGRVLPGGSFLVPTGPDD